MSLWGPQHRRFVLATDGLWDVMSAREVAELVRRERHAATAASMIANQAFQRRMSYPRKDDITVIVVDVNYHNCPIPPTMLSQCVSHSCVIA